MQRFWFATLVLLPPTAIHGQDAPILLRDGQQVTLTGRITMEPAGRLQFVTIKTAKSYQPMVSEDARTEHPADATNEIGLSGYNRYDLLYPHRGQAVTVTGTIMTDSASPYYFHNVSLKASSIRLANGDDLIGTPRHEITFTADVKEYRALAELHADLAAPWSYNPRSAPSRDAYSLSCSSNGGGDVVNCFCAKGFHPIAGQSAGRDIRKAAVLFHDGSLAQFETGDDKLAVELSVTCSR